MDASDSGGYGRAAGFTLASSSVLSIVVMAHHPSNFDSGLGQPVHAAMLLLLLAMLAGFVQFAVQLDLRRFSVLAGLVMYCAGSVANLMAGTMNGFIAPALAQDGASGELMRFCWAFNQAFAAGAVMAISFAFVLWGVALVRSAGFGRWLGLAGIVAGAGAALALGTGHVTMNVAGAFVIYASQAIFGVLAAAYLLRGARAAS